MGRHLSPRYGHGILVSGYPVLTAVNWPYCEVSNVKDVDLARHAWDTPPFLLIVSPTPPVQYVDAYVRTFGQPKEKRLTIIYGYEALSNARFARVGAPLKLVETQAEHFAWLKSSSRFHRINKLVCDYSYCQFHRLFAPWNIACYFLYPINPKARIQR